MSKYLIKFVSVTSGALVTDRPSIQLTVTIRQDLKLTQNDVANSNILSLTATYADL